MSTTATLNIRLPENLKAQGAQVLANEGCTVSDAVRALYAYMAEHQKMPACLKTEKPERLERRTLLRQLAGIADIPDGMEAQTNYRQHQLQKHA